MTAQGFLIKESSYGDTERILKVIFERWQKCPHRNYCDNMKRFVQILIIICILVWAGGYIFYRFYFPGIMANAIISDETPTYIPRRIMNKVDELKKPVNKGADEIVRQMKKNDIPLDDMIEVIENTSEDEAYAFLDELNRVNPQTPDEVFDIAKKHIETDFDVELLRTAFVENVSMKSVRKATKYANVNQRAKELDIRTARAIAKQILIEKYQQVDVK